MQRWFVTLLAITLAASTLQAQAPPSPPAAAPQTVTDIKAFDQSVSVDVVVTDKYQFPTHNLTLKDFTLLEDNTPQQLVSVVEHTVHAATDVPHPKPILPLPPGIFSNYPQTAPPVEGTFSILLLDALNTPGVDPAFFRSQLDKYLQTTPVGTRIAILCLSSQLSLLQGFTSSPETLRTALTQTKPGASPAPASTSTPAVLDGYNQTVNSAPSLADVIASLHQFETPQQPLPPETRAKQTGDAMSQLAHALAGLSGRKNLIWFSASFPIDILPDGDAADPFSAVPSAQDSFRETTNLLSFAQVALYPVDARSLTSPTASGPNNESTPAVKSDDLNKAIAQTIAEHAALEQVAQRTGGHAYYSVNDLGMAVRLAILAGSNYYTLTYTPTNSDWNGKFRKLQVKLPKDDLVLTYRRGYFADDPSTPPRRRQLTATTVPANTAGTPDTPAGTVQAAMQHDSAVPTQILLKLRVLPASTSTESDIAPHNTFSDKADTSGPYRRYLIDFAADPSAIIFHITPDGAVHGTLQFLTYVYDQDGKLIDTVTQSIRTSISQTAYGYFLKTGLPFHQEVSVPAQGTYFLRSSIHDVESDRIGAVELPVAAVKNLAPLARYNNSTPVSDAPAADPPVAPK